MSTKFAFLVSMTSIIHVLSTHPNSNEAVPLENERRLLTANNFSTTSMETSPMQDTIFYETDPVGPHEGGSQIFNDLLYNPLYQIIVALAFTQLIALCCLLLYCRKQSATNKQIRDLSEKIDALVASNKYQKTVSHSVASGPSVQSPSFNPSGHISSVNSAHGFAPIRSRTNTVPMNNHALRTNNGNTVDSYRPQPLPTNSPPPSEGNNGYQLHTPLTSQNKTVSSSQYNSQYNPTSADGALHPPPIHGAISFSSDNETQMPLAPAHTDTYVRPWSPKTGNVTSLPPAPNPGPVNNNRMNNNRMNNNKNTFNFNNNMKQYAPVSNQGANTLHPTDVKLANAVYNMGTMPVNGMTVTPSHSADSSGDERNDGTSVIGGKHGGFGDSLWSNTHNILSNGMSAMSVQTVGTRDSVNDADSVLGEMLGLNVMKPSKKMTDVDIILEIVDDEEDEDANGNATKENTLLITDHASYHL